MLILFVVLYVPSTAYWVQFVDGTWQKNKKKYKFVSRKMISMYARRKMQHPKSYGSARFI